MDGASWCRYLINAWAYSHYGFALALPTERTEAILAGLVEAFTFFGCVPHEVWWDNPRTVVLKMFKGRERRPTEAYRALASHYTFEALFCMPRRGNSRSRMRKRVSGSCSSNGPRPCPWCPRSGSLECPLEAICAGRAWTGRWLATTESIGERFRRDRAPGPAVTRASV